MTFSEKLRDAFSRNVRGVFPKVEYTRADTTSGDGSSLSDESKWDDNLSFPGSKSSIWKKNRLLISGHILIFTLYAVTLYLVAVRPEPKYSRRNGLPFSPAIQALQYEEHVFSLEDRIWEQNLYSNLPSPEVDKAWADLIEYENILLEPEVMAHYGRLDSGVFLPDGSGYVGTLNVYHQLHCLKRIKQHMYPDYYFPNISASTQEFNRMHNEHCIDFLRQSAMCHGDIGLITFEWEPQNRVPVANATTHQCVNWQRLDEWTRARTVDMMKPGFLVHPTLGIAYPNGIGNKLSAPSTGEGQEVQKHTGQETHEGANADEATGY